MYIANKQINIYIYIHKLYILVYTGISAAYHLTGTKKSNGELSPLSPGIFLSTHRGIKSCLRQSGSPKKRPSCAFMYTKTFFHGRMDMVMTKVWTKKWSLKTGTRETSAFTHVEPSRQSWLPKRNLPNTLAVAAPAAGHSHFFFGPTKYITSSRAAPLHCSRASNFVRRNCWPAATNQEKLSVRES